MTKYSKSALQAIINDNFADNNAGDITAALLRSTTIDITDSLGFYLAVEGEKLYIPFESGVEISPGSFISASLVDTGNGSGYISLSCTLNAGNGISIASNGEITPDLLSNGGLAINSNEIAMDINNLSADSNAGNLSDSIAISDASSSNDTKKITISQLSDVLGVFNAASGNRIETNTTNIATNTTDIATNTSNIATKGSGTMSQLRVTYDGKDETLFDASGIEFIAGSNVTIAMADSTSGVALTFSVPSNLFTDASGDLVDANTANISANAANISLNTSAIATKGSGTMSQFRVTASGKDENLFDGSGIEFIAGSNMTVSMTDSASGVGITFGTTGLQETIDSSNRLNANLIGANGDVSNTEFGYLSNVSSDIQSQLDAKPFNLASGNLIRSIEADVATKGTMSQLRVTNSGKDEYLSDASGIQFIAGSNMTISMADNTSGVALTFTSSAEGGGSFSLASGNLIEANTASIATKMSDFRVTNSGKDESLSDGSGIEFIAGSNMTVSMADNTSGVALTFGTTGLQSEIDSSNRLNANLIHDGSVSNTEFGYLSNVSSDIQAQLDAKPFTLASGNLIRDIEADVATKGTMTQLRVTNSGKDENLTDGSGIQFIAGSNMTVSMSDNTSGVALTFATTGLQSESAVLGAISSTGAIESNDGQLMVFHNVSSGVYIGDHTHSNLITHTAEGVVAASGRNVHVGFGAGSGSKTGYENTLVGALAGLNLSEVQYGNTFIGHLAGSGLTSGSTGFGGSPLYNNIIIGNRAGAAPNFNSGFYQNVIIGNDSIYDSGFKVQNCVALGENVLKAAVVAIDTVAIGFDAARNAGNPNASVIIGSEAGYTDTTPIDCVYIGKKAAYSTSAGDENVIIGAYAAEYGSRDYTTAIGYKAGQGESGDGGGQYSVYLGYKAGKPNGNSIASNELYIANDEISESGTLIKGDFHNKLLAVGNADKDLSPGSGTLQIFPHKPSTIGLYVEALPDQTAPLAEFRDENGDIAASILPEGVITASGISLGGSGIRISGTTYTSFGDVVTLDVGKGENNIAQFTADVADNDFLRIDGSKVEGRSASEVLSDIGAASGTMSKFKLGTFEDGNHFDVTDGGGIMFASSSDVVVSMSGSVEGGSGVINFSTVGLQSEIDSSNRLNANLIHDGTISNTEFGYLNNVSSNIQTQLDAKQASLTFGIANTNAVKIDSASVADDEYARFTANGLESRSVSEVRSDIGLGTAATGDFGIGNNNLAQFQASVADNDFLRVNGAKLEGLSDTETRTALGLGTSAVLDVGISNNNILQADSNVADDDFLRVAGTQIEGRSASELLSDIGAASTSTPTITGDATFNEGISVGKAIVPTGIQNAEVEPEDATVAIDLSKSNYFEVTLGADVTAMNFTNGATGQRFVIRFEQPAGANYSLTWNNSGAQTHDQDGGGSPANVTTKWPGGTAPTMTATNARADTYGFIIRAENAFDGYIIGQDVYA